MSPEAVLPVSGPRRAPGHKWIVALSVSFGAMMGAIDSSIVNVALPQIRGTVGATTEEITWVSTGFIIATVVVLPLPGFFARLVGQKRAYLISLAVFIAGSFLCGVAWSLPSLVLFRAVQGLGAGALLPLEQAILRQTFPDDEQGMAMAIFSTVITVGPAVGPTLGGYIIDSFHWAWIFFINLPVGLAGFAMVWRFVDGEPEVVGATNTPPPRARVDGIGIALLVIGLALLQYVIEEGQSHDWFESSAVTGCAVGGGLCLLAFTVYELTIAAPAIHLRLFKDPVFTSGALLGALVFFVLFAGLFLLSLFMQEVLGFTATGSGVALMPRTLVMIVTMLVVGKLYGRVPARALVAAGLLLTGLGVYQMGRFTLDTGTRDIVVSLVLQGLGIGLIFVPLNTMALDGVPRDRLADAAGLNGLLRQIGSSLGLALFATLLSRYTAVARVGLLAQLVEARSEVTGWLARVQGGLAPQLGEPDAGEAALRLLAADVARQATVLAFDRLFVMAALLFVVMLPLLLLLRVAPTGGSPEIAAAHVEV